MNWIRKIVVILSFLLIPPALAHHIEIGPPSIIDDTLPVIDYPAEQASIAVIQGNEDSNKQPSPDDILHIVEQVLAKAKDANNQPASIRHANLSEEECLATAMYHEARGEGEVGMKAVAFVIHNRTQAEKWPHTICGVVLQPKQFSFIGRRSTDTIKQWDTYKDILTVSFQLIHGGFDTMESPVRDATYFDSLAIHKRLGYTYGRRFVKTIGNHHFFK